MSKWLKLRALCFHQQNVCNLLRSEFLNICAFRFKSEEVHSNWGGDSERQEWAHISIKFTFSLIVFRVFVLGEIVNLFGRLTNVRNVIRIDFSPLFQFNLPVHIIKHSKLTSFFDQVHQSPNPINKYPVIRTYNQRSPLPTIAEKNRIVFLLTLNGKIS